MTILDTSELELLSANLGRASARVIDQAHAAIAKGALNIKNETRDGLKGLAYWAKLTSTVNYEQVGLWAEIGYDDRNMGELAGIFEFGSVKHAPHPTLIPAARAEAPRFEKAMGDLAVKAIGDAL